MFRPYTTFILLLISTLFAPFGAAEDEAPTTPAFAYYTLAPDLTTNIYTKGQKIGYLQVRIDLMVADNTYIPDLEQHDPLIRDAIIELIGKQSEDKVKTLAGREEFRKELMDHLNSILLAETGRTLISELLFTKYLYQ